LSTNMGRAGPKYRGLFPSLTERAPSARDVQIWDGPRPPTIPRPLPGDFVRAFATAPERRAGRKQAAAAAATSAAKGIGGAHDPRQSSKLAAHELAISRAGRWPAATAAEPGGSTYKQQRLPSKPRFLRGLEDLLDECLVAAKSTADEGGDGEAQEVAGAGGAGVDPASMEVYQHVFTRLIEEFRTYGPLLARIKAAYEENAEAHRKEIAGK
jgi:hypothetical protein